MSALFAADECGRTATWPDARATLQCLVARLVRRFVHGPGVDEPLVQYEGAGTSDRRYLIADQLGSIVAANGASTTINSYDEYGTPGAANAGRFQYTGQMWLPEAQLYHYKARAYVPALGRFAQTDPIGLAGGMNLYAYVGNDPVNFRDPLGMEEEDCLPSDDCPVKVPPPSPTMTTWGWSYSPGEASAWLSIIAGYGDKVYGWYGDDGGVVDLPAVEEEELVVTGQQPRLIRVQDNRSYAPSGTNICELAYLTCRQNRQAWYDRHVGDSPANDNAPLDVPTGIPPRTCGGARIRCNEINQNQMTPIPGVVPSGGLLRFPDGTVVRWPGYGQPPYMIPGPGNGYWPIF